VDLTCTLACVLGNGERAREMKLIVC
jgi:hypothetical protein